ncbi:hypothetical protein JTE90_010640 [Oedothorax gibbosus]|uniref:Cuticle protein n=1 Tax=Oedothorax gibbosus TaxID=931172 RepID=A0AAV6U981_9ARAC|nr:hypothetical protein JTE90_010640 [Oedothorax gibbosus]
MIAKLFVFAVACVAVQATNFVVGGGISNTYRQQSSDGNYAFGYDITDAQGATNSRSEKGDGAGNVQGSYTLRDTDGRARTVDYVADQGGYRAVVKTNEQGTASSNPAKVVVDSPFAMPVAPEVPEPVAVIEETKQEQIHIEEEPAIVAAPAPVTSTSSRFTIVHGPTAAKVVSVVPVAVVPRPAPVAHPVTFIHNPFHTFSTVKMHPFVISRPYFINRVATFGNFKGTPF